MNKQRTSVVVCNEPTLRMTRSRTAAAAAVGSRTSLYVLDHSRPENNLTNQRRSKKTSSSSTNTAKTLLRGKRKTPLRDLTNVVAAVTNNGMGISRLLPLRKPDTKINQMRKSNKTFSDVSALRNLPSKRKAASLVDITNLDHQNPIKRCNSRPMVQVWTLPSSCLFW